MIQSLDDAEQLLCRSYSSLHSRSIQALPGKWGMTEDFETSLQVLRGFNTDITTEVNEIKLSVASTSRRTTIRFAELKHRNYYWFPLMVGIGLLMLQLLSGVNGVLFYSSTIFKWVLHQLMRPYLDLVPFRSLHQQYLHGWWTEHVVDFFSQLIKEYDGELKNTYSKNDPDTNKMLTEKKQPMIKELDSYVALKNHYCLKL